jgi:hypothetical protein
MPIKHIDTTAAPGHMIHICAACGAEHKISFDRGAQKTKRGPFQLRVGDTLVVRVDDAAPATATFGAADFPDFARVPAAELAAKLNTALPGIQAHDDGGGVLIESASVGAESRVQIVDGAACAALGFSTDGRGDACHTRPVLGVSIGAEQIVDKNVIALRRCNDCGANECLVRTFDVAPAHLAGTHFAEHRKVVNSLAEHCKSQRWSHPAVAEHHAAETTLPADVASAFPDVHAALPRFLSPVGRAEPRNPRRSADDKR